MVISFHFAEFLSGLERPETCFVTHLLCTLSESGLLFTLSRFWDKLGGKVRSLRDRLVVVLGSLRSLMFES